MELLRLLPDVTGSIYLKMAAAKPEVLISQLPDKIATQFQRLNGYFWGPGLLRLMPDVTGSRYFKMVVANSAMYISMLVSKWYIDLCVGDTY